MNNFLLTKMVPQACFVFVRQGARVAKNSKSDLIRPTICGVPLQLLLKALFDLRPPCVFNFSLKMSMPHFCTPGQKMPQKTPKNYPYPKISIHANFWGVNGPACQILCS